MIAVAERMRPTRSYEIQKLYIKKLDVRQWDIWMADLSGGTVGSEQSGKRPVLVLQNDIGNKFSTTIIVAAITSQNKTKLPTHVELKAERYNLEKDSVIMLEQLRTIDKLRLKEKITTLDKEAIYKVLNALDVSLGRKRA